MLRTSSRMFLLNSWLSRISRSLSSRSRSLVASSRSTPVRWKSRSVRSRTRAASASSPLGSRADRTAYSLVSRPRSVSSFCTCWATDSARSRTVASGCTSEKRDPIEAALDSAVCASFHTRSTSSASAGGSLRRPSTSERARASCRSPTQSSQSLWRGRGRWVGWVVTDGTVCRRPPAGAERLVPELQGAGHDAGEVAGAHLTRARGEQALLLEGALDEVVHVALGVADGVQAVGHADVAQQVREHARQHVAGLGGPPRPVLRVEQPGGRE